MDIKTGLSIYNKQWLVEPQAALQMLDFWEKVKSGETEWNYREAKGSSGDTANVYEKFFAREKAVMAPDNRWDMEKFKGFDGASVAIIPVSGPLMKSDYCGSFGTASMARITQMAAQTQSVKTIMYLIDSPGGTVDGTETFANAIKAAGKKTIALVDGMMCSAAYWIGSACDEIYATSGTDIIGSIGTMCAFYDATDAMKARGVVLREFYATESTDKNRMMREAMGGDGRALISEMLDPLNNEFLKAVRANRAGKINTTRENVLTGKTYTSQAATAAGLIDGIQSFEYTLSAAVKEASEMPRAEEKPIIIKQDTMSLTLQQLKQEHPEAYQAAFEEGKAAEGKRVKTWMVYKDIDPEAVAAGIKDGKEVDSEVMAEMQVKAVAASKLDGIRQDGAAAVATTEATAKPEAEAQAEDFRKRAKDYAKQFR